MQTTLARFISYMSVPEGSGTSTVGSKEGNNDSE